MTLQISRFELCLQQWATFARQWWLYDARHQCAFRSAEKIIPYLEGRHKPIYHPMSKLRYF